MVRLLNLLVLALLLSCQSATKPIKGAVVSAREEASKIGVEILHQGGNAYDAMVATSFALSVVYPVAGNITGGGFFVYRNADGTSGTLDFREEAPLAAHRDLYLDKNGDVVPNKSTLGGLSVGVPGAVAGALEVHEKMGTLPLKTLIQPSIDLARNGFIVTKKQAENLANKRSLFIKVNGENTFYGKNFKEGDTIKNEALAKTLEAISKHGRDGFYKGWVAEAMIKKVNETGGIFTQEDLDSYQPKWRDAIEFSYKDLELISMPPPSSGGVCLNQIMKMIEPYDIASMGHNTNKSIRLMVEAERRSYADRSKYLGDPDFANNPIEQLLDSTYLVNRMNSFDWDKATPSSEVNPGNITFKESDETTHFSILDSFGNAVSVTTTLNGAYGSKVFVDELGVFMNNEMDDFSSKAGVPNMFGLIGSKYNEIAPKKRMLSSMTPTIVLKNGKLFMIVGSPGGSTIITSVFQTILNVYEHKMRMQEAVNAPRFHHQWLPDLILLEPNQFGEKLIDSLRLSNYNIEEKRSRIIGKVDAILVNNQGEIETGADKRGDDAAAVHY